MLPKGKEEVKRDGGKQADPAVETKKLCQRFLEQLSDLKQFYYTEDQLPSLGPRMGVLSHPPCCSSLTVGKGDNDPLPTCTQFREDLVVPLASCITSGLFKPSQTL